MNNTQQLKDQLRSSNHLLIPLRLPAYRKGAVKLAGDFGIEFPARKLLLSVDDGEGDTLPSSQPREKGWQDRSPEDRGTHALCLTLCALVPLAGPFGQVPAIGERWEGKRSSHTSTWTQGWFWTF